MMLGHPTPPGPSSDAADLMCAVCPGSPKGHGTGFGAMNWSPPPETAELPPWTWLVGLPA